MHVGLQESLHHGETDIALAGRGRSSAAFLDLVLAVAGFALQAPIDGLDQVLHSQARLAESLHQVPAVRVCGVALLEDARDHRQPVHVRLQIGCLILFVVGGVERASHGGRADQVDCLQEEDSAANGVGGLVRGWGNDI